MYGAAIPDDAETSLIIDMYKKDSLPELFDELEGVVTQRESPFYGFDDEYSTVFPTRGCVQTVNLVNARDDGKGREEYYESGRTRQWMKPKTA